jgi:hypothetical protein
MLKMRLAEWSVRKRAVEIIAAAFEDNPGVNWLLKKSGDHSKKIRRMAEYAFIIYPNQCEKPLLFREGI